MESKLSMNTQRSINILKILAYISMFTASFDMAFNFKIAGFNFRLTQISMIILIFFVLGKILGGRKLIKPINIGLLLIYVLLNTVFLYNAIYKKNAIGYELWLLLNIVTVFVIVNLFTTKEYMYSLFKMYIYSFVFVAVLGMIQYVLFKFLHINFYMSNSLNDYDRIHGFCYEPSYYSTYLLPAWCLLAYMYEKKCTVIFDMKKIKIFLMMITLVLILSFSRMGLLMMFVYLFSRLMANSVFGLKRTRTGFSVCISKRNIKTIGFVLFILAVVICYILYMYYFQFSKFQNMMYGLGVFGTAGHSAAAREGSLGETLQIFKNSPIIGCSLGDLDGRVARIRGLLYRGETGMTMSIFAEQFAATGIVGGFCFVLYIIKMCFGYRKYKKYNLEYLNFVKGLCLGLIFQTLILNMNQNVLRPYFWLNIAVLSVAYRGFAYMLPKEEGREK